MLAGLTLAKVLFNVAGFDIRLKDILRLAAVLGVAFLIYLAYDGVRDHFANIRQLEADKKELTNTVNGYKTALDIATTTNESNAEVDKLDTMIETNNRSIAQAEHQLAAVRTTKNEETRRVIKNTPPPTDSRREQPVAPVVTDTLERLWGEGGN